MVSSCRGPRPANSQREWMFCAITHTERFAIIIITYSTVQQGKIDFVIAIIGRVFFSLFGFLLRPSDKILYIWKKMFWYENSVLLKGDSFRPEICLVFYLGRQPTDISCFSVKIWASDLSSCSLYVCVCVKEVPAITEQAPSNCCHKVPQSFGQITLQRDPSKALHTHTNTHKHMLVSSLQTSLLPQEDA